MDLPGPHDPLDSSRLFQFEHATSPNLSASRIFHGAVTRDSARVQFGDRIKYGDTHVHHYLPPQEIARPVSPRRPINTLKWLKDPHFVGREHTLERMKCILEEYGCVALTGAGGVGKSQTAIEFCWRWLNDKPKFSVFWIYAASIQAFDDGYAQLARKLRLDCAVSSASKTDVRDGVKDWLEDNSDWLMVVDNADSYVDFFGGVDGQTDDTIRNALPLPRPGSGMIVYTSRHARLAQDLTEHHELPIENLPPNDSKTLLRNKLGTAVRDELAVALLEVLESLPMSIAHAAAYLKFTKISIREYLDRVKDDANLLELLDSESVNVGRRDDKASRSVVKVLLTTLDLLALHNEHAAALLALMACLDRQSISAAVPRLAIGERVSRQRRDYAIELPTSRTELDSAIGELESLALISRHVEGRSFSMHRHVQAIITRRMSTSQTHTAYLLLCAHCVLESYFPGVSASLAEHHDKHPHRGQDSVPGIEPAYKSLANHPRGYKLGLLFFRSRGIFSHTQKQSTDDNVDQIACLKYICSSPLLALLAAARMAIGLLGTHSTWESRPVRYMADLHAAGSFIQLEKVALQTIQQSAAHSVCMVAAKFYLALAVANTRRLPNGTPVTNRSVDDLMREALEEADAIQSDQDDIQSLYDSLTLLIDIHVYAGDFAKAINVQERIREQLSNMFGPKDLQTLDVRMRLAELKGARSVASEELRELERDLQEAYDGTRHSRELASDDERRALTAINLLSRVKVLSCWKMQYDMISRATHRNAGFAVALKDTERILNDSMEQIDKSYGVFNMLTTLKACQVHGFLLDFGSAKRADDFAFKRAESMLTEMSGGRSLSDDDFPVIEESIKLFAQHDCARPLCEKILFTFLRHLRTQRSGRSVASSTQAVWSPLEFLHAMHARSSPLEPLVGPTETIKHTALCDACDKSIIGIRHKCLQCPDYDVCTACLGLKTDSSSARCSATSTSRGPHRFAPMYEHYHETSLHREAAHWREKVQPSETKMISHALQANPGRFFVIPIHARWHNDLTDGRGYESEPDEGRRTKTRYGKHYARREVEWFDGGGAARLRARSCESLKLAFVLSRL